MLKEEIVPLGLTALFAKSTELLSGCTVSQVGFVPELEVPRTVKLVDDELNMTLVITEPVPPTRRVNIFEATIVVS